MRFHHCVKRAQKYYVMSIFLFVCCLYTCSVSKAFAFAEMESATTFRGEKKSLALPPVSVHVALEAGLDSERIQREWVPLLEESAIVVKNKEQASLSLSLTNKGDHTQASLVETARPTSHKNFTLPQESEALQKTLLGYAHSLGLRSLQNATAFPDVVWNVQVWTQAKAGELGAKNIQGEFWKPSHQISGIKNAPPQSYNGRTILSFSFMNNSGGNFYIYALNATDGGQIVPILAPTSLVNIQNTLHPYKEHSLENMFLELSSHEENVILIISREPLDLSLWQQDDFNTAAQSFLQPNTIPAPENWTSRILTFIKK